MKQVEKCHEIQKEKKSCVLGGGKSICSVPYSHINGLFLKPKNQIIGYFGYYGLIENEFKIRCSQHKSSFRDKTRNQTTLSSYIWKLKDRKIPRVVNWSIKARGHPFSSGGRACDLCLTEKLTILTADQNSMLNKRDELLEACRHRRKHLLVSLIKPPDEEEPPDTTIK